MILTIGDYFLFWISLVLTLRCVDIYDEVLFVVKSGSKIPYLSSQLSENVGHDDVQDEEIIN